MLPGSVLLFPRPVTGLLGWDYPEQLGLSSTVCNVGRFHLSMHKWGLAPSPNCECGASEQTADHVLTACPIHRAPHVARDLTVLDDETGLITPLSASDSGSAAVWGSKRINPQPQSCLCLAWSGYPSNDDDAYPVLIADTFPLFRIFSYTTTALSAEPCRKLSLGPRIHNADF